MVIPFFATAQVQSKGNLKDSIVLKEIAIVFKKKQIEYRNDRMVINVANSISAIGGNAVNAISAAPGIIVQNGTISMLGKGESRVMIDGRLIELRGQDLIGYLNAIPAGDIQKIEVITNPPAKYEAGADGGIINIILKKGTMNSWKNTALLAYDQSTYGFLTLRNSFLYNRNKVRFSLNAGGKTGYMKNTEELDIYYPKGVWQLNSTGKEKQGQFSGGTALDYDFSVNTTVGFQYTGNYNNPDRNDLTSIGIHNPGNSLDSILINKGLNRQTVNSHSFNGHLISKLDTLNRKLSFDIDYFSYRSTIDNDFVATVFSPDLSILNINQAARNISDQNIHNMAVKTDMEHPLKFMNLSYGAKLSLTNSKSAVVYYNMATGTGILDPNRSNGFEYKEHNQAVYINGNKQLNARCSVQLGLRLENTQTLGYSETTSQTIKNNYLKLFPTFYLSFKANEANTLMFNYGKRINRPEFRNLNPFRSYLNSNSYSEGNPFLQPSYSNNFDFTHIYKGVLRTNAFINITTNGFGVIFSSDPKTNTQVISRQNYFKEYYYGIGENYTADIAGFWQSQNQIYMLGSRNIFSGDIQAASKNGLQLYLSTNNTFSLGRPTKLQADFFYATKANRGLYEIGSMAGLNLGLKQNILRDKLQLGLLVNDVFNTAYLKNYTSVVNGIRQVYSENNSSRYFRISLTYNFGNNKINVKSHETGNSEEKKRTE